MLYLHALYLVEYILHLPGRMPLAAITYNNIIMYMYQYINYADFLFHRDLMSGVSHSPAY